MSVRTSAPTAPPTLLPGPLQGSLWSTLPAGKSHTLAPLSQRMTRHVLDPCCWVDTADAWLSGADDLLIELLDCLAWSQGRRLMYGTFHDEPRLSAAAMIGDPALPDIVGELARSLSDWYARPFDTVFCNYYRDGQDSVAWHADRVGQQQIDPLVAIICLGGPRPFRLRPRRSPDDAATERGESHSFALGSGDLLIMGGATQHHWEHAVPKVKSAPPRMSVTIRSGPGADGEEPARAATRSGQRRVSRRAPLGGSWGVDRSDR